MNAEALDPLDPSYIKDLERNAEAGVALMSAFANDNSDPSYERMREMFTDEYGSHPYDHIEHLLTHTADPASMEYWEDEGLRCVDVLCTVSENSDIDNPFRANGMDEAGPDAVLGRIRELGTYVEMVLGESADEGVDMSYETQREAHDKMVRNAEWFHDSVAQLYLVI